MVEKHKTFSVRERCFMAATQTRQALVIKLPRVKSLAWMHSSCKLALKGIILQLVFMGLDRRPDF